MEVTTPMDGTRLSQSRVHSGGASSTSYEEIMGITARSSNAQEEPGVGGGASALTSRLVQFREWLQCDANAVVHPSVCIVNGEATDGTKNAPVLTFGPPISSTASSAGSGAAGAGTGRCGAVDRELDQALYDRTIGCQVRVVRELKKDETIMTIPRGAMLTPDLVASSDAGKAVFTCCEQRGGGFWGAFENTAVCEKRFVDKLLRNSGTQLLVKILQERKKAETSSLKADHEQANGEHTQARFGTVSTRAPILAFLIHQRFSNEISPPVMSSKSASVEELRRGETDNAGTANGQVKKPPGSPSTFAPYVRTLPSAVPLPICWKRNELALLAGCIPGVAPLQEVAARTFQLAAEFVALVDSGICCRYPSTFPPGLITWERWVWAASVFTSRVLPVSCYLNKGEQSAAEHVKCNGVVLQSPAEIWDELGVMIPLLDMLNHDGGASQVTWEPSVPAGSEGSLSNGTKQSTSTSPTDIQAELASPDSSYRPPQAVVNRRVKKGSQLYCNYGHLSNQNLMLQYGFAQINNPADEVRIGWGLADAVGSVECPSEYVSVLEGEEDAGTSAGDSAAASDYFVYESADSASISSWWTDNRIEILEKEALLSDAFIASLKTGKKMTAAAFNDGKYHPIFLTASVLGTMPPSDVGKQSSREPGTALSISKRHQSILRHYLAFVFTRKLEKLLQNLNTGLKAHFNNVQLWTRATQGGLQYRNGNKDELTCTGWQAFFDSHAYSAAMELEKNYYAVGPDSCVLALYDGHLRSLWASIDGISTWEKFENNVGRQLEELGFVIEKAEDTAVEVKSANNEEVKPAAKEQPAAASGKDGAGEKSNKKRNRKKGDRPPALKLHIGNLAYTTNPANLFDFFAGIYGRENILECHIPTERGSGRSRGFGFVTMPESVALKTLQSGRKHEIDGRLLKVAQSNSAGAGKNTRVPVPSSSVSSDRCASCGYRPKYCTCTVPKIAGYNGSANKQGDDSKSPHWDYVEPANAYGRSADDSFYGASGGRRHGRNRRSYSRSSSPRRGSSRSNRDDGHRLEQDRGYRDYRHGRSRSRSLSFEGERDRGRDRRVSREKRKSRDNARSGSRSSHGGGGNSGWGRRRSRERSPSEDRSRSRSYTDASHSRRDRKSVSESVSERLAGSRMRGSSRSVSPHRSRSNKSGPGSGRKREGHNKKRSRSRSRGRCSRRKRRRQARSRSRSRSHSGSHSHSMRKE